MKDNDHYEVRKMNQAADSKRSMIIREAHVDY